MTSSASPKNVEKDVSENESDGALEEVNSHIKAVFEILNSETTKARKEMKSFDTIAKKLKHVHFSKTLKLNVGGQLFSTSLDTMKKDPGKSALSPVQSIRKFKRERRRGPQKTSRLFQLAYFIK